MGFPSTVTAASPPDFHRHHLLLSNPNPNPNPNPKTTLASPPRPLLSRRSLLLSSSSGAFLPYPAAADPYPAVTDRVFMDFSLCPSYLRSDRPLGFALAACPDTESLGRVVFGLYGDLVPHTVANFKTLCASAAYRGTLIHKILQGQYFMAGRQGRRDRGEVRPPRGLERNMEIVDPRAFRLKHARPGTLSMCLSENDDDDRVKLGADYWNVEFLVTMGPGPCPQLDGENIVFGIVLEGLNVVTSIATIPTNKPAERIRQFNDFAKFIGDERAQTARIMWNRPLETVYISDCGELKVS